MEYILVSQLKLVFLLKFSNGDDETLTVVIV